MSFNSKAYLLLLACGLAFASAAQADEHQVFPATTDVWDGAAPWSGKTLTDFAGWSFITFPEGTDPYGNTPNPRYGVSAPDDAGSGQGTLKSNNNSSLFTGGGAGGNLYSWAGPGSFTATLTGHGNTGDLFDVYVRMSTVGLLPTTSMTLNGVQATSTNIFYNTQGYIADEKGVLQPSAEQESYWLWENVSNAALYSFVWTNTKAHVSLDQLQIATVLANGPVPPVTAVPEPETYAMLLAGLGFIGFATRRRSS